MSLSTRIRCALAVMDYFIFAIGGSCISLLLLPSYLFGRKGARRWGAFLLHIGWIFMRWLLFCTRNLTLKTQDRKSLRELRSTVVVANHPSLIDIVILISLIPKGLPMAKAALRRWFFLRPILNSICIVNDVETEELLTDAKEALQAGYNIIIFPEGTRTSPLHKSQLHRGAARLALAAGVDIQPIRIDTSQPFLTKEAPWWYVGKACPVFTLTKKEPISAKHTEGMPAPKAARHLTRLIGKALEIQDGE